jgi:hypothetical protein
MKPLTTWKNWQNTPWNLVSKHQKELAIFPILHQNGATKTLVIEAETDQLGTFSGEIPRNLSVMETLEEKCKLGFSSSKHSLFIATEGSFGPHPLFPWVPQHQESFILFDRSSNSKFYHHYTSQHTNFQIASIHSEQQLVEFCNWIKFPSHGIILKKNSENEAEIFKDIFDWKTLFSVFKTLGGTVMAESDMRAMNNPTRMANIRIGFSNFLTQLQTECPKCEYPGFSQKKVERGLPCQWCDSPTSSILYSIHVCEVCQHEEIKSNPNGKTKEDPMYCSNCNP